MDWFLYDNGLRHERVNLCLIRPVIRQGSAAGIGILCKMLKKNEINSVK